MRDLGSAGAQLRLCGPSTILRISIQDASRPREGTIPPELFGSSEHQPHFCPL